MELKNDGLLCSISDRFIADTENKVSGAVHMLRAWRNLPDANDADSVRFVLRRCSTSRYLKSLMPEIVAAALTGERLDTGIDDDD